MPITVQSVRDVPADAVRYALQANGSVLVYLPGDTLPPAPPAGPAPVPQQVTRRQFYRALRQLAWFGTTEAQIEAAVAQFIAALPEPPREDARIDWSQSTAFLRSNPMLIAMLPALGKTSADLDALFVLADSFPSA